MARIAVDALGGDRAPDEIVAGALEASADGIEVILFGPAGLDTGGLELVETTGVIEMHEKPAEAVRAKPDSSLVAACRAVGLGNADAVVDVSVDAREYHADKPGADEELLSEYVVADDQLDLTAWARDAIALALPDQILHAPDCAGLCPVCGKDLNVEPHTHADETNDPRWSALEELRDRL